MFSVLHAVAVFVSNLFKSRGRLEAENVLLRHQLNVALRRAPDLTGLFWTERFERNCLGKEPGDAEEEI